MPTLVEYIEMKQEIERERRGWETLNTVSHALYRLGVELVEAQAELGNPEELGKELADVFWFAIAALNAYLKEYGGEPVVAEQLILSKMYEFTDKYDPAIFRPLEMNGQEYTVFDGQSRARHIAKHGLPEGSDVY